MPPPSGVPVHIILHALTLLVVIGYDEHQRYPKTAVHNCKNTTNALKQGSRTHSATSAKFTLQKYKVARMCECLVE